MIVHPLRHTAAARITQSHSTFFMVLLPRYPSCFSLLLYIDKATDRYLVTLRGRRIPTDEPYCVALATSTANTCEGPNMFERKTIHLPSGVNWTVRLQRVVVPGQVDELLGLEMSALDQLRRVAGAAGHGRDHVRAKEIDPLAVVRGGDTARPAPVATEKLLVRRDVEMHRPLVLLEVVPGRAFVSMS